MMPISENPVSLMASCEVIAPNRLDIRLDVKVEKDWHVFSDGLNIFGQSFVLDVRAKGVLYVDVAYPEPHGRDFKGTFWHNEFCVRAIAERNTDSFENPLRLLVSYQACSSEKCLTAQHELIKLIVT